MNALDEVRRRSGREDSEMVPHTAGAEDPETTPEEIRGMINNVFNEGNQRKQKLDDLTKGDALDFKRDGSYSIRYSHVGTYADFHDQANHAYLKEKYPFLHSVDSGLGFDPSEAEESHGEFEIYLASIPHEDWVAFLEDMESLENYPLLDEEGASELEQEEVTRWVTEDGGPDLIKEMIEQADNSYDAYLLSKVTIEKVFEWMGETSHYPEASGQGDVWMDMDRLAKEDATIEWFLEEVEDDEAGWLEQKRLAYADEAGTQFSALLRQMATENEQAAHVYNNLDAEGEWQLFLKAFPDERREDGDPYWYLWKHNYDEPGAWKPGFEPSSNYMSDWKPGYTQALAALKDKEWFKNLVLNWFRRGPEGHPEFKFESDEDVDPKRYLNALNATASLVLDRVIEDDEGDKWCLVYDTATSELVGWIAEPNWTPRNPEDWLSTVGGAEEHSVSQAEALQWVGANRDQPRYGFNEALETEPDPDDPEVFMKYGGGFQEEVVYEDAKIVVLYPRDFETLNYHLRRNGLPEITAQTWSNVFKHRDIFVIQGKQPVDLLGHESVRELAVVVGDSDVPLQVWTGIRDRPSLKDVLANPEYGRSIRRMLLRYYRERAESDTKAAHVLLQLGGARELRRIEKRGISMSDMGVATGLHYVAKHKYKLAAKAFRRSLSTMTPQGVWLVYDSVEDLSGVFKNEEAATTVFAHDHYGWFDHYYEPANRPAVSDVIPFLDQTAIDHIRSVLINRKVWFPDGGPDGRGEYVVLTPKTLAEYDDATILDWLANPSDEDENDGVFEDIIEAIQFAGVDILQSAAQDMVYSGYVKAAVNAIDGKESKWTTHPTKKYQKTGESMEAFKVFVPWTAVSDWAEKYRDSSGYNYDGDLEELALNVNAETADPDIDNMQPSWRDVNKEWAKENLNRIHELEPPEPIPGSPDYNDPDQIDLPLKEDEDEDTARLKREYGLGEPDYDMPADERESDAQGFTQHRTKQAVRDYLAKKNRSPVRETVDNPDLDDPSAMPGMLSGIPVDLERRVKAILQDSSEAHGYTFHDLTFQFEPYVPHAEDVIDASDGRLYNLPPHYNLIIQYRTEPLTSDPTPPVDVDPKVFGKVRDTVVNVMREFDLKGWYSMNPTVNDMPDDWVIMHFVLYPHPAPHPQPEPDPVPF